MRRARELKLGGIVGGSGRGWALYSGVAHDRSFC